MTLKELGGRIYYGWSDALKWASQNLVISLLILVFGVMLVIWIVRAA